MSLYSKLSGFLQLAIQQKRNEATTTIFMLLNNSKKIRYHCYANLKKVKTLIHI